MYTCYHRGITVLGVWSILPGAALRLGIVNNLTLGKSKEVAIEWCKQNKRTRNTYTKHFVDKNSASNRQKEGVMEKPFQSQITQNRTPNKDDPQYSYKCKRSVLYEFKRTLATDGLGSISVGTTFN